MMISPDCAAAVEISPATQPMASAAIKANRLSFMILTKPPSQNLFDSRSTRFYSSRVPESPHPRFSAVARRSGWPLVTTARGCVTPAQVAERVLQELHDRLRILH